MYLPMKFTETCHLTAQTYSLQKKLRFTPAVLTVLPKLLLFFLVRRLFEFLQIDLGAEDLLFRGYVGIVLLVHDAPSFTRI